MVTQALRLLLLRVLPRRVLPILTAIEIFRLIQRLRREGPQPVAPRRIVTVDGPEHDVVPSPGLGRRGWRAGWDSNPRPKD